MNEPPSKGWKRLCSCSVCTVAAMPPPHPRAQTCCGDTTGTVPQLRAASPRPPFCGHNPMDANQPQQIAGLAELPPGPRVSHVIDCPRFIGKKRPHRPPGPFGPARCPVAFPQTYCLSRCVYWLSPFFSATETFPSNRPVCEAGLGLPLRVPSPRCPLSSRGHGGFGPPGYDSPRGCLALWWLRTLPSVHSHFAASGFSPLSHREDVGAMAPPPAVPQPPNSIPGVSYA